jgi:hypothetical protein
MAAVAAGLAATPTPSYWIENTDTDFTTPTPLPTEADYCVVGGGLTGVSTAYWLNKMGHSCVLVEGRGLAGGASGRNGGVLSGSSEFQQANIEMLRAIMEEHGGAEHFEYRQGGYLRVALEGSEAAREYREARLDPERQELWTAERCARELGTDKIDGLQIACGVFGRTSGHFWPAKMVHAIAAGARMTTFCTHTRALSIGSDERPAQEGGDSSGSSGELREFGSSEPAHTPVLCIPAALRAHCQRPQHAGFIVLRTDRGAIRCKRIAVCTNGWSPQLLPELSQVCCCCCSCGCWYGGGGGGGLVGAHLYDVSMRRSDQRVCTHVCMMHGLSVCWAGAVPGAQRSDHDRARAHGLELARLRQHR